MIAVILAGGQGPRLWPLSRRQYPTQFLKIDVEALLLQETARRLLRDAQKVDEIVEQRKQQGRREADEHLIAMN
jgi:mannose-1-phosphate guanylyltransferase/mannose-6-phosphate isomerase